MGSVLALKFIKSLYGWIVGLLIGVSLLFAGYAIWDNFQIYQSAKNVRSQIQEVKPDRLNPNFDELRAINGDVVAWITVDGTGIDYPVLQGSNNLEYLNKDVYGEFSLAGSIYLDSRNSENYSDPYALNYGHNMSDHMMFGDLAEYKDETFFKNNTTAELMIPGETRSYQVAAVLQISAGTDEIFSPDVWKDGLKGMGEFLEANSIWYHANQTQALKDNSEDMQVMALVTCSDGNTNARTVLVLDRYKDGREANTDQNHMVKQEDDIRGANRDLLNSGSTGYSNSGNTNNQSGQVDTNTVSEGNHEQSAVTAQNSDTTQVASSDDVYGNGPKQTGDGSLKDLWVALIAGGILFILIFETVDRKQRKNRDENE